MKNNMKSLKIFTIILVTIILTLLAENFILKGGKIQNKTQIIKEMTQSENEVNLQTQINTLNESHNEYAINVQNYKKKITEAITNEGISTSETEDAEIVATNISNILQTRTSNATATAEDIAEGKTAYVDGKLITGTKENYEKGLAYTECLFTISTGTKDASIEVYKIDYNNSKITRNTYSYENLYGTKETFSLFEVIYGTSVGYSWTLTAIKDIETLDGSVKLKAGEQISWSFTEFVSYCFIES